MIVHLNPVERIKLGGKHSGFVYAQKFSPVKELKDSITRNFQQKVVVARKQMQNLL